jgi:hypothetical protein
MMRRAERTMQQLDPLGAGGSWDAALLISLGTWTYVVLNAVTDLSTAPTPSLTVVAALSFTLAIVAHLWSAAPRHAPYTRTRFIVVSILLVVGAVAQVMSFDGTTPSLGNDWGVIVVALIMASSSVFRPAADMQLVGLAVVVAIGIALALDSASSQHVFGTAYYVVLGLSPIMIVVLGQASYTFKATTIMLSWRRSLEKLRDDSAPSVRTSLALSVGAQLAEEFGDQTRPLLVGILDSGRISAADAEAARQLAVSLRARLLTVSSQSWLERTGATVVDADSRVDEYNPSARAAMIALISGLSQGGVPSPSVTLLPDPGTRQILAEVLWKSWDSEARIRTALAPYLRVMYVIFDDVRVSYRAGQVTLKFQYGDK